MEPVLLTPLKGDIRVFYCGEKVLLPKDIHEAIEIHWQGLLSAGKRFVRGEVFSIEHTEIIDGNISVWLRLSDYAHYLATIHNVIPEQFACRVIHTSVLVQTNDDKLVFGEMDDDTSTPKRLQCAGGGITTHDVRGDSIDMNKNANDELWEEFGISLTGGTVSKIIPWYVKSGGPHNFLGVIFVATLAISSEEFSSLYNTFIANLSLEGKTHEFQSLVFLSRNKDDIENFFATDTRQKVDYLEPLLRGFAKSGL